MPRARPFATLVKVALLLPLYGAVLSLAWLVRTPRRAALLLGALGLALFAGWHLSSCGRPLRVGTFNIRQFGARPTDMAKLTTLLGSLDADVLAVQEIQDATKLRELAGRLSRRVALSRCGGKSDMKIGFLYDDRRVELVSTREYPELDPGGGGRCDAGERPGLLGVFADGSERTVHLLAIHLTMGNEPDAFARRKVQWQRAYAIVRQLRQGGARDVVILGDANSAGYLKDDNGERGFVNAAARDAGMRVVTGELGCSEYWREEEGVYSPSLLDQAVATQGVVREGSARVHGYCEALGCKAYRGKGPPEGFESVSDHCPVMMEVGR